MSLIKYLHYRQLGINYEWINLRSLSIFNLKDMTSNYKML